MPPVPQKGENILTRKVGPLPAWGWAAVAFVGTYLYLRYRAGKTAAAPVSSAGGAASAGGTVAPPLSYGTAGGGAPTPSPTASFSTPSGFTYTGPSDQLSSVLGAALPTGAGATTASSPSSGVDTSGQVAS